MKLGKQLKLRGMSTSLAGAIAASLAVVISLAAGTSVAQSNRATTDSVQDATELTGETQIYPLPIEEAAWFASREGFHFRIWRSGNKESKQTRGGATLDLWNRDGGPIKQKIGVLLNGRWMRNYTKSHPQNLNFQLFYSQEMQKRPLASGWTFETAALAGRGCEWSVKPNKGDANISMAIRVPAAYSNQNYNECSLLTLILRGPKGRDWRDAFRPRSLTPSK